MSNVVTWSLEVMAGAGRLAAPTRTVHEWAERTLHRLTPGAAIRPSADVSERLRRVIADIDARDRVR
jgi:hypothetical protein